jgi:molybdopterin-containing oxidoreductase family iron-sulfur binding subunit
MFHIVQPGQAVGTIGLALDMVVRLKEEMMVGLNAYSLYKGFDNVQSVTLAKADGT